MKNRYLLLCILILILIPGSRLLGLEDGASPAAPGGQEIARNAGQAEGEADSEADITGGKQEGFPKTGMWAQAFSIILPAFNKDEYVFSPGIGGSLLSELYVVNRLPGILLGVTGSCYIYVPAEEGETLINNSAMFHAGLYTGYQFLFDLPARLALSPALYAGVKYYFSFHPGSTPDFASNPLFMGGVAINFFFNNAFVLGPVLEYQLYYDGRNRPLVQTMQFSLRTGLLF